jgi:hypothetical protein
MIGSLLSGGLSAPPNGNDTDILMPPDLQKNPLSVKRL